MVEKSLAFLAGRDGLPKTHFFELFDDFLDYAATDWVLTTTEAGSGDATEAVSDAAGGILLVTNANGANDYDAFQWAGVDSTSVTETFTLVAGKRLYFGARLALGDADSSNIVIGLHDTDTDPVGNTISDGIYFDKGEDGNLDFTCAVASAETRLTALATLANDTYVTVEFYYNGQVDSAGAIDGMIEAYVNGLHVGSVDVANGPTTQLAVSFAIENGAAAAETLSMDWIRCVQER